MKHNIKIISLLAMFFVVSQILGLLIINQYIDHQQLQESGEVTFVELPYDVERPPVEQDHSVWYIMAAILIGTLLLWIIIHFRKTMIWKMWYFLSVFITLTVAFAALINDIAALIIAFIISFWKIYKPSLVIHNISELFIYGGLAAIFVPIMNLKAAVILLILISLYDMYAVWKSKHMVKLAEFTVESKVFAGLSIPYQKKTGKITSIPSGSLKGKKTTVKNAILGGGDIGFPLLFAGVVMKDLMITNPFVIGFAKTLIITAATSIALYILFLKGEKNKFYPAMPFLSLGCFVGYGIMLLI